MSPAFIRINMVHILLVYIHIYAYKLNYNISLGELLFGSEIREDGTTSFTGFTGEKVCRYEQLTLLN